jgi:hypothetical protein
MVLYLNPAYGRTYPSQEAMLADWNAGKDFRITDGGPYTSKRDAESGMLEAYGFETVVVVDKSIRYIVWQK